jgi:FAD/FMN-containing dehydrogenase
MAQTETMEVAGRDARLVALAPGRLADLERSLDGGVLRPGEPGWDDAVLIWNGMVAAEPALVLQPASAADVATAVGFARDAGALLSVKGGGHNIAGTSIAENGATLDMSRMREVTVDPVERVAHVGAGCLLADVDRATQRHGLATVLGFISQVGVAGLTLGGGLGYLSRRFGWSVDNLLEVEIVTADGRILRANRDEHPDLFWAVRGAGANLGVVTRFTFRLHEVGPMVHGGLIAWPFERAKDVLETYRELTTGAPRELTAFSSSSVRRRHPSCRRSGTASGSARWRSATQATSGPLTARLHPWAGLGRPSSTSCGHSPTPSSNRRSTPPSRRVCTTTGRPATPPS